MTHKVHSGSNDLVGDTFLHDELRKGGLFCTPAVFDTSDIHVELKCYAVEVQSQTKLEDPASVSRLKGNANISVYKEESLANISPTDSVSCESFYSCQSSPSTQDVKHCKQNEYDKFNKLRCTKNNDLKEESLDQLNMVNALVLGNSINECLKHNKDQSKSKLTSKSFSKNDLPNSNTLPKKYYSGAFTCKINCNDDSGLSSARGRNIIHKKIIFEDDEELRIRNDKIKVPQELYSLREDIKTHDNIQKSYNQKQLVKNDVVELKYLFPKETILNIKNTANKPNSTIGNIGSSFKTIKKPDLIKGKVCIEHYKQEIIKGYEVIHLVPTYLKLCNTLMYPKPTEPVLKNRILCGDGNILFKKIPNSYQQINKYFLGELGDAQIKTLISQSLQKLQSENKQVSQFCVSLSCKQKATNIITFNTASTEDYSNNNIDLSKNLKFTSSETYLNSLDDNKKESVRITEITNVDDVNCCDFVYLMPAKGEESKTKRKPHKRKSSLPIIEEESVECLESVFSEENVADNCYLTDRLGNPISLFDSQGLPLTDSCGRPLRYANGQLMMKCDKEGLPVIDDELCDIRDMFGRTPHDERFDPSVKPSMDVHNQLLTHDGKPLLLFDTEGRPLTSVSGTMLVDCSGRGLVRLNTSGL